jgi:hypothetical protein
VPRGLAGARAAAAVLQFLSRTMQLRSSIHHRTRALCRDFLHRRTRGITNLLLNRRIEVEFPLACGLEFPAADQRIITNGTCALHAYGPNLRLGCCDTLSALPTSPCATTKKCNHGAMCALPFSDRLRASSPGFDPKNSSDSRSMAAHGAPAPSKRMVAAAVRGVKAA